MDDPSATVPVVKMWKWNSSSKNSDSDLLVDKLPNYSVIDEDHIRRKVDERYARRLQEPFRATRTLLINEEFLLSYSPDYIEKALLGML